MFLDGLVIFAVVASLFLVPLLLLWGVSRWRGTTDTYLFWALLSFPGLVIGVMLMLTTPDQSSPRELRQELELLQKLAELRDAGVLSEEEHEARKEGLQGAFGYSEARALRTASVVAALILVPTLSAIAALYLYLKTEPPGRVTNAWLSCDAGRGAECIASRHPNGLFPETVRRLRIRTEILGLEFFYTADVSPFADVEIGQSWPH